MLRKRRNFCTRKLLPNKFSLSNVMVVITNFGFAQNATALKMQMGQSFTTVLINCDPTDIPAGTDYSISNTYYPGLLRKAIEVAQEKEFDWIFFIASDVSFANSCNLDFFIQEAINLEGIGVYSPSVTHDSRTAFELLLNRESSGIREVGVVEGFIFLTRVDLISKLPINEDENVYGWGLDVLLCKLAAQSDLSVVVDDRLSVYHPAKKIEHVIDEEKAQEQSNKMLGAENLEWLHEVQATYLSKTKYPLPARSVDLGCGLYINDYFSTNNAFGIDIRKSKNRRILKQDLTRKGIPFPDRHFDYVTAFDFIEHVPRDFHTIRRTRYPFIVLMDEIHRVLKMGGIFLSLTPAYPDAKAFQDPTHVNFITDRTFPDYFCSPNLWGRMYGFKGNFILVSQVWEDGKLRTVLRKT
jgi:SAM-dependent methyltransferase